MKKLTEVLVPDIGEFKEIPVVEVLVKEGDKIDAEDSLITLESDKATMEVPAPFSGIIKKLSLEPGDKVSEGSLILLMEEINLQPEIQKSDYEKVENSSIEKKNEEIKNQENATPVLNGLDIYASPSVRKLSRELGVNLIDVKGSGPKGRILREDVQLFIKNSFSDSESIKQSENIPTKKYSKNNASSFTKELSRIKKISGKILHNNWITIPHITQTDDADITELDTFRKRISEENNIKLSPLVFVLKILIFILKRHPDFNSTLNENKESITIHGEYNIGIAVDTSGGLVVPVIRNANEKGIIELAQDIKNISLKAREQKLNPNDMRNGTFSISSLGGIGGLHFTPIINAPEVAILGLGESRIKPVWINNKFEPRLILPISLSYDHRVIDGAEGARFITDLKNALNDAKNILL